MDTAFFGRCSCSQCGGAIEFPRDRVGEEIQCPHCGKPTELKVTSDARSSAGEIESLNPPSNKGRRIVFAVVCVIVLMAGVIAGTRYFKGKTTSARDEAQGRDVTITVGTIGPSKTSSLPPIPTPAPKSRVNADELVRFSPLPATPDVNDGTHPPIPVRFTLAKSGYLTLIIENARGERVRNLISDTLFPAGENTVWWDGRDETPGKREQHEAYELAPQLVASGTYRIRGLFHQGVDMTYEFSVYSPGDPPWYSADEGKGSWLSDHVAPSSVLYLPRVRQIAIGCRGAENGHSLIFTDLKGSKLRLSLYRGRHMDWGRLLGARPR